MNLSFLYVVLRSRCFLFKRTNTCHNLRRRVLFCPPMTEYTKKVGAIAPKRKVKNKGMGRPGRVESKLLFSRLLVHCRVLYITWKQSAATGSRRSAPPQSPSCQMENVLPCLQIPKRRICRSSDELVRLTIQQKPIPVQSSPLRRCWNDIRCTDAVVALGEWLVTAHSDEDPTRLAFK
jgi:hypothetical protein